MRLGLDVLACVLLVGGIVALSAGRPGMGAAAGFAGVAAAAGALLVHLRADRDAA